ncbi:MAG: hypothetical protein AAF517_27790, partial [Planctomycetota bacterium]
MLKVAFLLFGTLGLLPSCRCVQIPDVSKYFDRETPTSALLGFVYAIETKNWDYAFDSLDDASREAVETSFRLHMAVILTDDPDSGRPVEEVMVEAVRWRHDAYPHPSARGVFLIDVEPR